MKTRWLGVFILLLILTSVSWATPFSVSQNSVKLVVAQGFTHTSVLIDISSASAGFDCSATTVSSNSTWVSPTIDAANQQLVLTFTNAALTNSPNAATVTLQNETDVQTVRVSLSLSPLDIFRLISDPFRSRVYGVHQSGTNAGSLIIYDPNTQSAVGCVSVGKKPTAMAVSNDGTELYVLNSADPSISVIDLSTLCLIETIPLTDYSNWGAGDTFGNIATGPGNILYYSDGSWAPALRVFDRVTNQVLQTITEDPSGNGVGGFALSQDKSAFLTWAQFGWSAGWMGSYVSKYNVSASGLLTFSQSTPTTYPSILMRDPLGTPVLGSYDNTRFFVKQWAVDPSNINSVVQNFPSPVYSITPYGEVVVTDSAIIQKDTGNKLYDLPFSTPVQTITNGYSKLVLYNQTTHSLQAVDLVAAVGAAALGDNLSPTDGSITTTPDKLQWSPIPGVSTYQVYLATSSSALTGATPASSCYLGQTNLPSISLSKSFTPGVTYYWRVDSVLSAGTSKGAVFSFTVSTISSSIPKIAAATVSGHDNYQVSVGLASKDNSQTWKASADQPWVSFVQNGGTLPATLNVVLNASSLSSGTYTANVNVQSGTSPAFSLPVTLKVEPLNVTILKSHPQNNRIYAISENTATPGATAYLMELDSDAQSILRVAPVGSGVTDLAIHVPEGRIYVTNWSTGFLLAVDMNTFATVRTFAFNPAAPEGYGNGDVFRISAGAAGRLVCEDYDQWIDATIFNTDTGSKMASASEREGGGAFAPGGRYYYHGDNNDSGAAIHKLDVTGDVMSEVASKRVSSFSYYGTRTVVMSGSGNGLFWNGSLFDPDLNEKWQMGVEIYCCSADAKYAFGETSVYDTELKQVIGSMPLATKVSCFNSTSGKLALQCGSRIGYYTMGGTSIAVPLLTSGSTTSTTVQLSWTNTSLNTTGFTLQKRMVGASTWDEAGSLGSGTSSVVIAGLTPETSYEFRLMANSNLASSDWSNTSTATTTSVPPPSGSNPTAILSGVSSHGGTLIISANPGGVATWVYVEYGADTNYGDFTGSISLGSGTNAVSITTALNSLSPGATYHYRVVTYNESGANYGPDQTLTTTLVANSGSKVIYNYIGRMTTCGAHSELGVSAKGNLVWDPATNSISGIFAFSYRNTKSVSVLQMSSHQVFVFKGASNKEYTAISMAQSSDSPFPRFESDLIKGRRSPVKIGNSILQVPKSMTDSEVFVDQAVDGEPVLVELKGSYVLDVKASAASNAKGESVDEAATRLKAQYQQMGYQ